MNLETVKLGFRGLLRQVGRPAEKICNGQRDLQEAAQQNMGGLSGGNAVHAEIPVIVIRVKRRQRKAADIHDAGIGHRLFHVAEECGDARAAFGIMQRERLEGLAENVLQTGLVVFFRRHYRCQRLRQEQIENGILRKPVPVGPASARGAGLAMVGRPWVTSYSCALVMFAASPSINRRKLKGRMSVHSTSI